MDSDEPAATGSDKMEEVMSIYRKIVRMPTRAGAVSKPDKDGMILVGLAQRKAARAISTRMKSSLEYPLCDPSGGE